ARSGARREHHSVYRPCQGVTTAGTGRSRRTAGRCDGVGRTPSGDVLFAESWMRRIFLWMAGNRWLRGRIPRLWFVRRAVRRFLPGEDATAALNAGARFGTE